MDNRETSIYVFRMLVYVLYLEIGALQPHIHREVARKARLDNAFFQRDKEREAVDLYRQVENEMTPARIVGPFMQRTGLNLEDISQAFMEGDWRNKFGVCNFGGPKWARIAEAALKLRERIEQEDWEGTADLVHEIKGLKNNQGYLIKEFERVERRH
jgi:hypothetical protein